jgi:hypothetical protein
MVKLTLHKESDEGHVVCLFANGEYFITFLNNWYNSYEKMRIRGWVSDQDTYSNLGFKESSSKQTVKIV